MDYFQVLKLKKTKGKPEAASKFALLYSGYSVGVAGGRKFLLWKNVVVLKENYVLECFFHVWQLSWQTEGGES